MSGGKRGGKPHRCRVCRSEALWGDICEACREAYRAAAGQRVEHRHCECGEPLRVGKGPCGFCVSSGREAA